jgi:hypothetical protein
LQSHTDTLDEQAKKQNSVHRDGQHRYRVRTCKCRRWTEAIWFCPRLHIFDSAYNSGTRWRNKLFSWSLRCHSE